MIARPLGAAVGVTLALWGLGQVPLASSRVRLPADTRAPADTVTPAAAWLTLLPDGEIKRRFILDCAGCHVFDARITREDGTPRSPEAWEAAVARMLSFAGAGTGFPIMAPERDAARTAEWLAAELGERAPEPAAQRIVPAGFVVVEYPLPRADLPHDLAIAHDGRIVVTGMLTGVLYTLDPATGDYTEIAIPVEDANPRAVEVAPDGAWWIVLGGPAKLARYDPASGAWGHWDVGVYAHEAAIDSSGRVWYNGHFTQSPEVLGVLDPATGATRTFEVPSPPAANGGSTISYGLRAAPDGTIWMTQLIGNRLVGLDPSTGAFTLHDLPTPHSGPRRLDVDARGDVWVPEFANDRLARFSPASGTFEEHVVPTHDALPYVARIDDARGVVWLGTAAGDLVARFEPTTGAWIEIPLPTESALVRHIAIDPRTGELWGAYAPFPVLSPKVFVIRAR